MQEQQKNDSAAVRAYRERLLADPYRPRYHFSVPDGNGHPGDPNGAFFADGRYHLMYLYRNDATAAYHWGHISSADLLHWRHHPDALTGQNGDEGCYSGGAFLDDDGCAYLTFWRFPDPTRAPDDKGGVGLAKSAPPYDVWERIDPESLTGRRVWGILDGKDGRLLAGADPSNIWKSGGRYYMQTGNLILMRTFERGELSDPVYQGDYTDLFRSDDLLHWEYLHRFYTNPRTDPDYPGVTEDDMCPSFLPLPASREGGALTDRYLQLFIAHNRGAQYYVGTWDEKAEVFLPKRHGRFSFRDRACFAPEALLDGKNRQIAWFWQLDNPDRDYERFGWSGVYSFPRVFWWEKDELRMAPAEELSALLSHEKRVDAFRLGAGERTALPVADGECFRLRAEIAVKAGSVGFALRADDTEETRIVYDADAGELVLDTTDSGGENWRIREAAPFSLRPGETLSLDILVDRSIVEVYANERAALSRRVYPSHPERATGVFALATGEAAAFLSVVTDAVEPTEPY